MAGGTRYNFFVCFFVALGSFAYGFNSSIMGLVIGLPAFFQYFNINLDTSKGNQILGATNGLYSGGGAIGCWTVPWLLDRLGRRRTIQACAALAIVSAIIQTASVHIAMFLVGRTLNGIAVAAMDVSVPVYLSEISPARQRGRMVGAHGIMIVSGYAIAGYCGYGTYFAPPSISWRLSLALQIVAPMILLLGSPWLPQSPRWLVDNDRQSEALATLEKLHYRPEDPSHTFAKEEFYQIRMQIELERTSGMSRSWTTLFTTPSYRKRLILGFGTQLIAQSTGCLVVNNYQVILYRSLDVTGSLPLLLNGVYNTQAAFMNLINSLLLDRIGRIKVMLIAVTGCATTLICFAAMVAKFGGTPNTVGNVFGIIFLFLYAFFYAGMDVASYLYCSELFPTPLRAHGAGFSISGLFLATIVYTQPAPLAFANIGWKYLLVFIILGPLGGLAMWRWFPETKLLSLEEIAALFKDEVAVDITHLSEGDRAALDRRLREELNDTDKSGQELSSSFDILGAEKGGKMT